MECVLTDQQRQLIASFIDIAVGQTEETAIYFLNAASWYLEDAINLFLVTRRNPNHPLYYQELQIPRPMMDTSMYQTSEIWDSTTEESDSSLSSLNRPCSFEDAKATSFREDLWLLVNLQSTTKEFASHTLNRVLWSNEAVSQAIDFSFNLWQVYDHTNEGQKISTLYNIDSAPPVILLIDPITGQKMHTWSGMIEPQAFLEDLMMFIDVGPQEYLASLTSNKRIKTEKVSFSSNDHAYDQDMSTFWDDDFVESGKEKTDTFSPDRVVVPSWGQEFEETMTLPVHEEETCLSSDLLEFPVLTQEPKEDCDRSLLCSLCVRFPDGRRNQRKFFKSEPIQLLWSFCYSLMEESEKKAFKLVQAIPGASKTLDYGANATFDQSGIANSMISVTW